MVSYVGRITIGQNISSLVAQRRLEQNSFALSRTFERLSSGQRINRASDDSAGLAIATSLTLSSRVYTQGMRNLNDSISALSIAEGALSQLTSVTIRIKELAIQSANGTLSLNQRQSLDREALELQREFNRVVGSTSFNGKALLDGSFGRFSTQAGFGVNESIGFDLGSEFDRKIGTGSYASSSMTATGSIVGLVEGDFNNDGILDLIDAASGANVFMRGNGDGTFSSIAITAINALELRAGDINGDGFLDLVNTSGANALVRYGNGDGTFQGSVAYSMGGTSNTIKLADLNGDGKPDIIGRGNGVIRSILNTGAGFASATSIVATGNTFSLEFGDIDNDGKLDALTTNGATGILALTGNGNGTFASASLVATVTGITNFSIADVNYDGKADIVAFGSSQLSTLAGSGNGAFTQISQTAAASVGGDYRLVDADADGVLDIISANGLVFKGTGTGEFQASSTASQGIGQLLVGDFNRDGVNDFIIGVSDFPNGSININLANTQNATTMQRVNLLSAQDARSALSLIDSVLSRIQGEIGAIGAYQSRLQITLSALAARTDNYDASKGRILDGDIARESAELTRQQILQQTASAVLAQANTAPQLALTLLK